MRETPRQPLEFLPLTALDLQVLLVLSEGDLYGYAIMKAVDAQSGGILSPEIGSLYRVLARLAEAGWVQEAEAPPPESSQHRGKPRRYYGITDLGRSVARAELNRLKDVVHRSGALGPEGVR